MSMVVYFTCGYTTDQYPDSTFKFNNYPSYVAEISDFKISKFEVLQEDYEAIMGDNPSRYQYTDSLPVESLDYYARLIFCNELSLANGYTIDDLVYFKDSSFTNPYQLSDYLGNGRAFDDDPNTSEIKHKYPVFEDRT